MEKILICTNHFYPETFRVNDVAFHLAERGYDVTVLTAIPDYPKGKYYEGYGLFKRRSERIRGVKVIRGFIIPRGQGGAVRIVLNYLSFFISSVLISLYLGLFRRFDHVFVHETSPVMIGVPAVIVKALQRIPLFLWVLDLWPESLQAAGGINNKRVLKAFERLTKWIYNHSDKILISSQGFRQSIMDKGDYSGKLVYFPNWADHELVEDDTDVPLPELPQGFIVMFAGNMGEAQDFEHIMDAAQQLSDRKDIHFVIVGSGRKQLWTEQFVASHHLEKTVHLLGRYPMECMPYFFSQADVMLISLKDISIFNLTVPAKLQAYMGAGKPIIAMMNGEGPQLIADAHCGCSVPAGDSEALARAVLDLSVMDKQQLLQMGYAGKAYQQEHFNFEKNMVRLEQLLNG
ncbi:MAG: glycosyltransferase family 4 protein [Prevotella sp.]|nr:glycosyltransferase family 4 protein [Prevotella sp.]